MVNNVQGYLSLPITNENIRLPDEFKTALHAAMDVAPRANFPMHL